LNKRKKEKRTKKQIPNEFLPTLQSLLDYCKISEWDALIIGDGSGAGWDVGIGWAGVLIDRKSCGRKLFFGSANIGTITIAEMFPYLLALSWYTRPKGAGIQRRKDAIVQNRPVLIHIITDSLSVVCAGNNLEPKKRQNELWEVFNAYRRRGFEIHFHHVGRSIAAMNVLADEVARQSRLSLHGLFSHVMSILKNRYKLSETIDIYSFNP